MFWRDKIATLYRKLTRSWLGRAACSGVAESRRAVWRDRAPPR
jgi:hypothetical protein